MEIRHEAGHAIIQQKIAKYRWKIRTTPGKCRRFAKLADAQKWARENAIPEDKREPGGPLWGLICGLAGVANPLTKDAASKPQEVAAAPCPEPASDVIYAEGTIPKR